MKWRERIFYLAIIVAIILLFRACERGCQILGWGKSTNDTISVKVDTVYIELKADTVYTPEFVSVTNTIHVPKIVKETETISFQIPFTKEDTLRIVNQFYQKAYYEDVVKVGDYGNITIRDTIHQNRISSRRVTQDIRVPEVTKTITLRDKRTVGYLGVSAMGNKDQPLHSIGADFSLKLKSDYIISAGVKFTKAGQMWYEGGFKTPIRLKKR